MAGPHAFPTQTLSRHAQAPVKRCQGESVHPHDVAANQRCSEVIASSWTLPLPAGLDVFARNECVPVLHCPLRKHLVLTIFSLFPGK